MKIIDYFRQVKERKMFNASNCRAKMRQAHETRRDLKIAEITDRIKFVTSSSINETTVIFRVDDGIDYDYIGQHFTNLGFIVIRKAIEEL